MLIESLQSQTGVSRKTAVHPLDNVIWNALNTRLAEFAQAYDRARRFVPDVSPLGGFAEPTDRGYASVAALLDEDETIGLFLEKPYQPRAEWKVIVAMPMPQMVYSGNPADLIVPRGSDHQIVELDTEHVPQMMTLTALTKPGPFNKRTHALGRYVGIFNDDQLVAMAGERLKVPGYTEVSAVCTHPDHAGRGYAHLLMSDVIRRILDRGEIPFLHVRGDNLHAIGLYERMGFKRRVLSHLAVLRKDSSVKDFRE
jgi:ribosomal protein S18 acetylase RimI-like enzyme